MVNRRALLAALDSYLHQRKKGARTKRHKTKLLEFVEAELRSLRLRSSEIQLGVTNGHFYQRPVDLIVKRNGEILLNLVVITQSGSVKKNVNNRRREIVADAFNLRAANPRALVAVLYFLRADKEARKKNASGRSSLDTLAAFFKDLQTSPSRRPLLDEAALVAANREKGGRIQIEPMPPEVDVKHFFDKLVRSLATR